jgi:hypothetical protein
VDGVDRPGFPDCARRPPFWCSLSLNTPEIAKMLIGKGIKLDSWAISKCTSIQNEKKRMEIVELLKEYGAE